MDQNMTNDQKINLINGQIQQLQSILAQQHVDLSDPNLFNDDYDLEPSAYSENDYYASDMTNITEIPIEYEKKSFTEDEEVDLGSMF